jgi:hypothetical protein
MKSIGRIVLCLLIALPLIASPKAESVPFTVSPEGMLMVPARVGGTAVHLIFDTGAGLDVLAPSLIQKVHGKPAGQFTGFRMTGERLDIPLFLIPELALGPVAKKDDLVGSFDLLDQMHIDGIVSLNNFRQQPLTLDFVNSVIVFENSKTMAQRRLAGTLLPLELDDQRGISLDLFAHFVLAGQPGQCDIDTGSQSATLSMRYLAMLGIDKDGKEVRKRESKTIAGNTQIRYSTKVAGIAMATAPAINLAQPSVSFSDIIYDCVIGTDFWSGKVLTIDIPHHNLVVTAVPRTP